MKLGDWGRTTLLGFITAILTPVYADFASEYFNWQWSATWNVSSAVGVLELNVTETAKDYEISVQLPGALDTTVSPRLLRGVAGQVVQHCIRQDTSSGALTVFPRTGGSKDCDRKAPWTDNEPIRLEVQMAEVTGASANGEVRIAADPPLRPQRIVLGETGWTRPGYLVATYGVPLIVVTAALAWLVVLPEREKTRELRKQKTGARRMELEIDELCRAYMSNPAVFRRHVFDQVRRNVKSAKEYFDLVMDREHLVREAHHHLLKLGYRVERTEVDFVWDQSFRAYVLGALDSGSESLQDLKPAIDLAFPKHVRDWAATHRS